MEYRHHAGTIYKYTMQQSLYLRFVIVPRANLDIIPLDQQLHALDEHRLLFCRGIVLQILLARANQAPSVVER